MSDFVNVYNFIPLPSRKQILTEDSNEKRYTGAIHYTITPRTPMCIPNTSSGSAFQKSKDFARQEEEKHRKDQNYKIKGHISYDFYSYTNLNKDITYDRECHEPVIPGSEIRGVIRNVYETLTDACMSSLNEKIDLSKRVSEPFKPGLIHRTNTGSYELVDAISMEWTDGTATPYKNCPYEEGQEVFVDLNGATDVRPGLKQIESEYVSTEEANQEPQIGIGNGYIIKGEDGPVTAAHPKRLAHIFLPGTRKRDLTDDDLSRLEDVITISQNVPGQSGRYVEYSTRFGSFRRRELTQDYFPVYYSEVTDGTSTLLYLSPACVTRERYSVTISELAREFVPCKGDHVCPACALFGRVDSDRNIQKHITSTIRFSDMHMVSSPDNHDWRACYYSNGKPVTLEPLSGPKLSNTEFYLERPDNAKVWTYEYYVDQNGNIRIGNGVLRGRKNYWHQPSPVIREDTPSNQNRTVRILKSGEKNKFEGKVFFDGITESQLGQLLWILNGGSAQEQEKDLCYKIGAGKPFGLGSIRCQVMGCTIREFEYDPKDSLLTYVERPWEKQIENFGDDENKNKFTADASVRNAILTMFSFKTIPTGTVVSYPKTPQQASRGVHAPLTEGFKWYTNNRVSRPFASRERCVIDQPLPKILSNVDSLKMNYASNPQQPQGDRPNGGGSQNRGKQNHDRQRDQGGNSGQRRNDNRQNGRGMVTYTDNRSSGRVGFETFREYSAIVEKYDIPNKKLTVSVNGQSMLLEVRDLGKKKINELMGLYPVGANLKLQCLNAQTRPPKFKLVE